MNIDVLYPLTNDAEMPNRLKLVIDLHYVYRS